MRRRALLASLPATAGLAGCLDGSRSAPADSAEDTEPADPQTSAGRSGTATATVGVTFHPAIRYYHSDDAIGVDAPEHDQFAFVSPPPD